MDRFRQSSLYDLFSNILMPLDFYANNETMKLGDSEVLLDSSFGPNPNFCKTHELIHYRIYSVFYKCFWANNNGN